VSKHLAEHECLQAHADGLNVVIASASAVVGPHDFMPSRLGRAMIDYAQRRLPAYIPGGFVFVFGADIAEGHVPAMRKGRYGQDRLDGAPEAARLRRQTVEHVFGTLKAWMGSNHFLTKTLPRVQAEMSLQVLAYNLKRAMKILGAQALMNAMRT
jgi:nucleoside-diphosphate-sugar epimerase